MDKIAIVGATGATGQELVNLALKEGFSVEDLVLIASTQSVNKQVMIQGRPCVIQPLTALDQPLDAIFLAAGQTVSTLVKDKIKPKGFVIDLSSKFRQDPKVPLIIPEINPEDFDPNQDNWVASPNCVTTLQLMVLAPIFKHYAPRKIILSTYQAASGAGLKAIDELKKESQAFLHNQPYHHQTFQDPYAFNLFTHNAPFACQEHSDEEMKIRLESQKILKNKNLKITATCVRVPTLRAHALSAYVEFLDPVERDDVYKILDQAPGIRRYEDFEKNRFATPQIASCQDEVFYGRIRQDDECSLWFWIVGDQLLKGAALNAWQIYQLKRRSHGLHTATGTKSTCF
jgi:aspartate-semialdehyde dehydrogenase